MDITIDGFVAGPNGELDWMTFDWEDKKLVQYLNSVIDSSDTLLMGRKMTDEFVNYWSNELKNPTSPQYSFAKKMIDVPKVVLQRLLMSLAGPTPFLQKETLLRKSTSSRTVVARLTPNIGARRATTKPAFNVSSLPY